MMLWIVLKVVYSVRIWYRLIYDQLFLFGDNMEKKKMSRILIPVFIVIALNVLSGVVAKNIVYDHLLIQILLMVFFIVGYLVCWIVIKLEI